MKVVPHTRLLFWVAVGVVPLATLATAVPSALAPAAWLVLLFALVAATDAVRAFKKLEGIHVELPEVVRLTKDRKGAIDLLIGNEAQQPKDLRLGLAFPREIESSQEDLWTRLPAHSRFSRVSWPCTATRRGQYALDRCHLEGWSPFGFWSVRTSVPVRAQIRVYANLLSERRNLAALFLHRSHFGIHAQRQVGQGRDFEKLRDYLPSDPLNEIHWKATAKRSRPVTKVFQIEKTQQVYVIIDASRLSTRPSQHTAIGARQETVLERFMTAALVLGLVAEQQRDLFGLVTFSDKVQTFVRARTGKAHYNVCRDALYTLHPRNVTPDFADLCTFLRLRLRRRALLLVLTSLDDPMLAESFVRHVDLIGRQHLVLVNILRPSGAQPLFSEPNVVTADDLYQKLGGHIRWHNLRELDRVLQRRGVGFAQLEDERLTVELVSQYLSVKQRQLL